MRPDSDHTGVPVTRRLFIAVALLGLLVPAPSPAQPASARLTILHTNDTHGHLLPFDYPTIVPAGSDLEQLAERRNIGGIAPPTANTASSCSGMLSAPRRTPSKPRR